MIRRLLTFAIIALGSPVFAQIQERDVDLNVAVFAYLPDASAAIKRLEKAFEARFATIDLDIELLNPYDDELEADGLSQLVDFDLVEIDSCRIDQLIGGALGGLDQLPRDILRPEKNYVGPAKTVRAQEAGNYLVPHWVCGNFLVSWSSNKQANQAGTFEELLKAMDPGKDRPVLAAMWGRTTLGEYYADAMLDIHGKVRAREHLQKLADGTEQLDEKATKAVVALADRLSPQNRSNLKHFDNHAYVLPRQFAAMENAVLLGYSERMYYTERERQLTPGTELPVVKPNDVVVRQFAFADKSQGTPCWVDGFVIPKGKLAKKRAAISAFLLFVQSPDAYLTFAEPTPGFASSYLLPATVSAYEDPKLSEKQPLLSKYLAVLDGGFTIADSKTWLGMRDAGTKLRLVLKP